LKSYFHVLIHLNENPDEQVLADNNLQAQKEHEILVSGPQDDKTRNRELYRKKNVQPYAKLQHVA
jgi:hypothetical protein